MSYWEALWPMAAGFGVLLACMGVAEVVAWRIQMRGSVDVSPHGERDDDDLFSAIVGSPMRSYRKPHVGTRGQLPTKRNVGTCARKPRKCSGGRREHTD